MKSGNWRIHCMYARVLVCITRDMRMVTLQFLKLSRSMQRQFWQSLVANLAERPPLKQYLKIFFVRPTTAVEAFDS